MNEPVITVRDIERTWAAFRERYIPDFDVHPVLYVAGDKPVDRFDFDAWIDSLGKPVISFFRDGGQVVGSINGQCVSTVVEEKERS